MLAFFGSFLGAAFGVITTLILLSLIPDNNDKGDRR